MSSESPTLVLRDIDLVPFTMEDAHWQYFGWLHDEEVIRFLDVARHDRSTSALEEFVAGAIANPNLHYFKIVARERDVKIGTISLKVDPAQKNATFGYFIGERDFWGTDAALQAQVGLFDFAFDTLGLRRIHDGACIKNTASTFNFSRLGFRREGILRAHVLIGTEGDETSDVVHYGLLADEWRENSAKFESFRKVTDRA